MDPHAVYFGEELVRVDLPDGVEVTRPRRRPLKAAADPLREVAMALDAPVEAPPLADVARGARRVTIVVPDATRVSGASTYLLPLVSRLAQAGLGPQQIGVVVARGVHGASPKADVVRVLGQQVMEALRAVQSAPDTPEMNLSVGEDEELGDVRVHRLVAEAGLVVLTGAVRPHHLSGFSGGPKAFVPGVAERETVLAAHRLTLRSIVRPDGSLRYAGGRWEANPFRDALLRVTRRFGRCWSLGVVLADDGGIARAYAGEVGAAHRAAVDAWGELCGEESPCAAADLVVAGARPPHDRDLVQAHKALLVASAHARPGAPILWLARAPAGPGHAALLPWFEIRKLQNHLAALRREFHPYGLTAYSLRRIARDHPVYVVSDMDADVLRPMGLLPFARAKDALAHALAHHDVRTCTILPTP